MLSATRSMVAETMQQMYLCSSLRNVSMTDLSGSSARHVFAADIARACKTIKDPTTRPENNARVPNLGFFVHTNTSGVPRSSVDSMIIVENGQPSSS
jgi:hypothetical protein